MNGTLNSLLLCDYPALETGGLVSRFDSRADVSHKHQDQSRADDDEQFSAPLELAQIQNRLFL
jgi:hypothetical protein